MGQPVPLTCCESVRSTKPPVSKQQAGGGGHRAESVVCRLGQTSAGGNGGSCRNALLILFSRIFTEVSKPIVALLFSCKWLLLFFEWQLIISANLGGNTRQSIEKI